MDLLVQDAMMSIRDQACWSPVTAAPGCTSGVVASGPTTARVFACAGAAHYFRLPEPYGPRTHSPTTHNMTLTAFPSEA